MTSTLNVPQSERRPPLIAMESEAKRLNPVKWWAAAGVGSIAILVGLFAAWILSGEATPTPTGPTPVPPWMTVAARANEAGAILGFFVMMYLLLIRPYRREGHISLAGMLFLAAIPLYWQDLMSAYFRPFFIYNTEFVQFGSWFGSIPGFKQPNANLMGEPLLFIWPAYPIVIAGGGLLGCSLIGRIKAKRPAWSYVRIVAILYVFMVLLDILLEGAWVRLGLYAFPSTIGPAVFAGSHYQFPVLEAVIWAVFWTVLACVLYFRNDKGFTVAERGIERLNLTGWKRAGMRTLALVGLMTVMVFCIYSVPAALVSVHGGPWPQDVQKRSYLTNMLCGPGTTYACQSQEIPLPIGRSSHVSPNGELVPGG